MSMRFYGKASCNIGLITLKSLNVIGSIGGTGEFEYVLDFFRLYGDKAERMVEKEYKPEEANVALGEEKGKVQIVFENFKNNNDNYY